MLLTKYIKKFPRRYNKWFLREVLLIAGNQISILIALL